MCGIAGLVGDASREEGCALVGAMTRALSRRGPDGEGYEQWPGVTLGHRRLSIFDLSCAGRQPMLSPDGQLGVVFNGAIYNFLELRAELERGGAHFRSHTDTEIILHGYLQWGLDALLARMRGMFAIALWDNPRRKLSLIRDRLGIKPLLYSLDNGRLAFASTASALAKAIPQRGLDLVAVSEFLEFGFVTDERSILEGVKKVPPATIVEWNGSHLTSRPFWALPQVTPNGKITFEDAVAETEKLLCDAVRLRLEADVPVGALLSGGVDSSLVCWAAAHLGADLRTFTVGTPGHATDESADAAATARHLGLRHSIIELSADEPPDTADLISAYGEPFACASALGMLRVSKAVKQEVTVLLTGDGGDDVFLGYPYHRHFWAAQRLANQISPPLAKLWRGLRAAIPPVGLLRRGRHFLDYATGGLGAVIQVHDGLPLYRKSNLIGSRLDGISLPQRQTPWSGRSARNLLEDFLLYDWRTTFTGEYLTKVDGGTMYYALEARSPFLDQDLWNFAGSLPFGLRLQNGELKAILREITRRRINPAVASRAKQGFEIPVSRWLANQWGAQFVDLFQNPVLGRDGFVHANSVLKLWKSSAPTGHVPVQLWRLFVLENWMRSHTS